MSIRAETADLLIIGAGAAGLMAGIHAGRQYPGARILVLDGAKTLGAKILVAGGGRCNVTHDVVAETAYAGTSRNAIKKVLRRYDVPETIAFFAELGVQLKREATGKLFPTTNSARTVLDALLRGAQQAGVGLRYPRRVMWAKQEDAGFVVGGDWGSIHAKRLILATGGRSLPKSGSDGHGYALAQAFGHTLTPHIFPALVPLLLPERHFMRALSGIAAQVTLEVRSAAGKSLASYTDALLCTHFGISGPVALDISRYWIAVQMDDAAAVLVANWLPDQTMTQVDTELQTWRESAWKYLAPHHSERLARALCEAAHIAPTARADQLPREQRRHLAQTITQMPLPVSGNRGYTYAEVTAGGIPLNELHLKTMESRQQAGLFLCGEICDVDGQIGGYNFQWAWSSGYVAGISALAGITPA
jgi:predicted Rossmann fold flavoprotein